MDANAKGSTIALLECCSGKLKIELRCDRCMDGQTDEWMNGQLRNHNTGHFVWLGIKITEPFTLLQNSCHNKVLLYFGYIFSTLNNIKYIKQ